MRHSVGICCAVSYVLEPLRFVQYEAPQYPDGFAIQIICICSPINKQR